MKAKETKQKLDQLKAAVKNNELNNDEIVQALMDLRELVKSHDPDPLVVKALRLTAEYMEANGVFNIQFLEEDESNDMTDFEYLLELVGSAENEFNREELRELVDVLKQVNG